MKVKLRILNIFYLIISAAAIIMYVVNPFLTVTIDCDINYEVLEKNNVSEILYEDFGFDLEDLFEEGEDAEIKFKLDIKVDNKMLIESWTTKSAKDFVSNNIIYPGVEKFENELETVLTTMTESAVRAMYTNAFEKDLHKLAGGKNLYAAIAEANPAYTQTVVKNTIQKITDLTLLGSGTLSNITEKYLVEYNQYATALGGAEAARSAMQLKATYSGYLDAFGLVKIDELNSSYDAIEKIVERYFTSANDPEINVREDADEEEEAPYLLRVLAASIDPLDKVSKSEDPFGYAMVDAINKGYFQDSKQSESGKKSNSNRTTIVGMFRIFAIILVLSLLTWAIKVFQFIFCLFRKTPYIRIDPLGIVTSVMQVGVLLLALFMGVASSMNPASLKAIPLLSSLASFAPIGFEFTFNFAAMIPGILVIVNALYSIVYGAVKKKFKFDYKDQMYGIE